MSSLSSVAGSSASNVAFARLEPVAARLNDAPVDFAPVVKATETKPVNSEELQGLVSKMQEKVDQISPALEFSVDKDTGKSVVKVTDRSTREVVWQFPSEAALQVSKELDRFQKGVLLSRKA